jgi:hypothetical protein
MNHTSLRVKAPNYYTASLLLEIAAENTIRNTRDNGQHLGVEDAINFAAQEYNFPSSARARAQRVMRILYRGTDGKFADFGKRWSDSNNEFAVKNVLRNRDHRVMALLFAGEFARKPIVHKFKEASTAPTPIAATCV